MSTHSMIGILNEDGTVTASYCHSDGYLTGNGALLLKHYSDESLVRALISHGDMSCLYPKITPDEGEPHHFDGPRQKDVCVFYGRDRGEHDVDARTYHDVSHYWAQGETYNYLFTNGVWHYLSANVNGVVRKYKLTERNTHISKK